MACRLDGAKSFIWTDTGILLIGPLETNFNEVLTKVYTFSFKQMYLEISSGKWRPFCFGPNVLKSQRQGWKYFSMEHQADHMLKMRGCTIWRQLRSTSTISHNDNGKVRISAYKNLPYTRLRLINERWWLSVAAKIWHCFQFSSLNLSDTYMRH